VVDARADPRGRRPQRGYSVNLTLCLRGFTALERVGDADRVHAAAVPLHGRLVHPLGEAPTWHAYGTRGEAIHSVRRHVLSALLIDATEAHYGVRFGFRRSVRHLSVDDARVTLEDARGQITDETYDAIIGADGLRSLTRSVLADRGRLRYERRTSTLGFREIPLGRAEGDAGWIESGALHVWPRGDFMLLGFPNIEGSLTGALYMPLDGPHSHKALVDDAAIRALFAQHFPDAAPYLSPEPGLRVGEAGRMTTIFCQPWSDGRRVVLIGDAAHAMLPLYGQGANAGFEDCLTFDACLDAAADDWPTAIRDYERRRKGDTDVMARLSEEHAAVLSRGLGDPAHERHQHLTRLLVEAAPDRCAMLYDMLAFSLLSYAEAERIHRRQAALVDHLLHGELARSPVDTDAARALLRRHAEDLPPLPPDIHPERST
ncbi:MAG: FAD-dependent monooxygenase, partial [Myxococcales bacterium]|nr:FAD-dependent monooxygenase [Myxococcales bacterium]